MCRSSAEHDALDWMSTRTARFAGSVVDSVEFLKSASGAIRIDIIAQRAAPMTQGAAEDQFDRASQCRDLRDTKFIRGRQGMDMGRKERFIHINISQTG